MFNHPLLSHEEEIALARRARAGDAAARETLIIRNLRLVRSVARHYYTNDAATDFEDLFQQGTLGLITAADRYDPEQSTRRFSTFAFWWVRRAVQHLALTTGAIRRDAEPGRPRNPRAMQHLALRQAPVLSLDAPVEDGQTPFIDFIPAPGASVEDEALDRLYIEHLIQALSLDERGQAVIRDWLSGIERGHAQEMHGVSRSWIYTMLTTTTRKSKMEVLMHRKSKSETCIEPGCGQPRMVSARGTTLTRCEEHQREYWRQAAQARSEQGQPTASRRLPISAPATTPPPDDSDKSLIQPIPRQREAPPCAGYHDNDCIYRQVIAMIADRHPQVTDLVNVLQVARRIRDDLGLS